LPAGLRGAGKECFRMLTDEEKTLIRDSWRSIAPHAERVSDLFFQRLFQLDPAASSLCSAQQSARRDAFRGLLSFVVKSLDYRAEAWRETPREEDDLFTVALVLGRSARGLSRLLAASEEAVGAALLWALDYALGKEFDASTRAAWTRLYGLIATAMRMGKLAPKGVARDPVLDRVVSLCAQLEPGGVS
jgi:hemoglobin-like flavoprotein